MSTPALRRHRPEPVVQPPSLEQKLQEQIYAFGDLDADARFAALEKLRADPGDLTQKIIPTLEDLHNALNRAEFDDARAEHENKET
jgi:hypothetical protein